MFQKTDDNSSQTLIALAKNIESRLAKLHNHIRKLQRTRTAPYIKIYGYQHLDNLEIANYYNGLNWKSPLYDLFYKTELPYLWISNCILYKKNDKKIAYVYLVSHDIVKYVKKILNNYLKNTHSYVKV